MSTNKKLELFVPGRLCIMGEHSDWAGYYRTINSDIIPGEAIVTGIEQGIYAEVEKDHQFSVECEVNGFKDTNFSCEMNSDLLRETAASGGFFSYVAGVASYVNDNYCVSGLRIKITKMDLPIKSGLSSSAAICVLVARAFNTLYQLKLNIMGEMFVAFMGEQRTPSRCGRLDQACAYGVTPVHMIFEGNEITVKPLVVKKDLYWVIIDLNSNKNTIKILSDLNKCYPFAENMVERNVQEALGADNRLFISEAIAYIEAGEAQLLGAKMSEFQKNFDKKVAPACPDELKAPVLHTLLEDRKIKDFTFGGKGVGSQGDGTAQFLARDQESQNGLIAYLKDTYGMTAYPLTLKPKRAITKAIIPVAGFGTRLFPATKAVKKDFLPVLDRDGILKPAILIILEELVKAGIEQIGLIIGEEEKPFYDNFFAELPEEMYKKLPENRKGLQDLILAIAGKITYIYQRERKGFGHAVYQAREFANDEAVLLLLGDMIYHSNTNVNCMAQMMQVYNQYKKAIVSIHKVAKADVTHYGILHGTWQDKGQTIMNVNQIVEKPTVEEAEDFLSVKTRDCDENYYAVFGQYIITPEVFLELESNISKGKLEKGEFQLTSAIDQVREKSGVLGYVVDGESFDIGLPRAYIDTVSRYYKAGKETD